eukprot:CAMPEP_0177283052 /NCGR_PEP_ID=MMETSP0367-20130122/71796_1 /TAXON_ID=447022 ORGANISM="Scrippsiella hangoei-like, Strain SHHI-4" /NCGR_SAMPLE_ID=MMETSP0367 /ASSEMBLY_ACC=CAM_ASM_000362 /LENGTH=57 /DNA_ID=CAMNT_0018740031 /DNA_START=10 /DNA_END=179 /DNA_ORIENTATION=-
MSKPCASLFERPSSQTPLRACMRGARSSVSAAPEDFRNSTSHCTADEAGAMFATATT